MRSLDIEISAYGFLLIPVLTSTLPTDLQTLFARTFSSDIWLLNELLIILKDELEAKERSINPAEKHLEKGKFSR